MDRFKQVEETDCQTAISGDNTTLCAQQEQNLQDLAGFATLMGTKNAIEVIALLKQSVDAGRQYAYRARIISLLGFQSESRPRKLRKTRALDGLAPRLLAPPVRVSIVFGGSGGDITPLDTEPSPLTSSFEMTKLSENWCVNSRTAIKTRISTLSSRREFTKLNNDSGAIS